MRKKLKIKNEKYLLDSKLPYKIFKRLYDAIPDSGPTPMSMDKILWKLMKEKKIYIWLNPKLNDFFLTIEPPVGKFKIIKGNQKIR